MKGEHNGENKGMNFIKLLTRITMNIYQPVLIPSYCILYLVDVTLIFPINLLIP